MVTRRKSSADVEEQTASAENNKDLYVKLRPDRNANYVLSGSCNISASLRAAPLEEVRLYSALYSHALLTINCLVTFK